MESPNSPPNSDSYDPGSSVSSYMMEEYEDLLRYAVVTPNFDGSVVTPHFKASLSNRSATTKRLMTDETFEATKYPVPPVGNEQNKTSPELMAEEEEDQGPEGQRRHPLAVSSSNESTMNIGSRGNTGNRREPARLGLVVENPRRTQPGKSSREDDVELARLDSQLDVWCSELKSNVLAEFIQSKLKLKEKYNRDMQSEREQHVRAVRDLNQDLHRKLELLKTCESSMAKKDEVITSLTKSLRKQKEQVKLARTFSAWKFYYMDKKREAFTEKIVIKHCSKKLKSRVLCSWFGLIQGKWKQRVERACQMRAEEVCHEVTNEYEDKLAALHHSYEEALGEISVLRQAQSTYEENMKKAFMRGVCALNMEAMTMFNDSSPCVPPTNPPPSHHEAMATNSHHNITRPESGFQSVTSEKHTAASNGSCRHLNVKFHKSETKKGTKKTQPLVSVERHGPSL